MFDKFGEFNSAEEINEAVAAQLAEGDMDAIYAIAEENGIDKEDAEDYIDGIVPELVNPLMAALGKLKVETSDLKIEGILKEWEMYIEGMCADSKEMSIAVRRKGKNLKDCMAALIKYAFENKVRVNEKIVKATKVMHNGKLEDMRSPLYLGIPDKATASKIITDYYMK